MVVGKVYQKVGVQWYWELHQSVDQNWAPACQCGTRPYWATCWFRNKLELRINNKIRVCNKNDKSVKMLIMWCFRWGKFVYPSSAVPPTDEDLIMEVEEQVISTHTLILDFDRYCCIISIKVGSYSSTFLGSILGGCLTVGAAIALLVGCFLYRKSRRFTFIVCTSSHVINMFPTGSLLGDLFVVWSPL